MYPTEGRGVNVGFIRGILNVWSSNLDPRTDYCEWNLSYYSNVF